MRTEPLNDRGTGILPVGQMGVPPVSPHTAGETPAGPTARAAVPLSSARSSTPLQKLKRGLRRLLIFSLVVVCALRVAWLLLPKPELFPPGAKFSPQVFARDGQLLHLAITPDGKYRIPANLDMLSPSIIEATLEMEDRRFFSHSGADLRSMLRATWGVVSGQRLGGGSTLTMQYARLRWGLKTRSVWGKLTQMFRAVQTERHYSKREIIEAYFTFAPYGGNVEGIEAASRLWCGKAARELTLRESAALAVIPQSPAKRRPRVDDVAASPPQARLMARLHAARGEEPSALDAEFVLHPSRQPRRVPHLARRTGGGVTTIEAEQQSAMEESIADFLERWRDQDVRNAAAILVHAPSREVRAYVGSADFFNVEIQGQVDGVTARRSPGSALKPFIYALAMDQGLIHPHTLLDDAPQRFGTYNPENSDRGFLGPISAADALCRSRNVPAVELASRLAAPGLDGFLRKSGVALKRLPGEYGLSLALGGGEVTLEELARLYAMLASDGVSRPLIMKLERHSIEGRPANEMPDIAFGSAPVLGKSLSQAGSLHYMRAPARWLTLKALSTKDAPDGLFWKSGTSHGFRDAWACGVLGDWVLCVWVGNFNGKPMPGLFARDTAGPLLFQTVMRMDLDGMLPARPGGIVDVELCADSGMLACPHCFHRRSGAFIEGVSPIAVCNVHREVTLPDGKREVREFWPLERLEQFRQAGLSRAGSPIHTQFAPPPRIISPQPALTYVVRPAGEKRNAIPLEVNAAAGTRQIYWFAGARYIGASIPSKPLLWNPMPGRWTLQAVDDAGRSAQVVVNVAAER